MRSSGIYLRLTALAGIALSAIYAGMQLSASRPSVTPPERVERTGAGLEQPELEQPERAVTGEGVLYEPLPGFEARALALFDDPCGPLSLFHPDTYPWRNQPTPEALKALTGQDMDEASYQAFSRMCEIQALVQHIQSYPAREGQRGNESRSLEQELIPLTAFIASLENVDPVSFWEGVRELDARVYTQMNESGGADDLLASLPQSLLQALGGLNVETQRLRETLTH